MPRATSRKKQKMRSNYLRICTSTERLTPQRLRIKGILTSTLATSVLGFATATLFYTPSVTRSSRMRSNYLRICTSTEQFTPQRLYSQRHPHEHFGNRRPQFRHHHPLLHPDHDTLFTLEAPQPFVQIQHTASLSAGAELHDRPCRPRPDAHVSPLHRLRLLTRPRRARASPMVTASRLVFAVAGDGVLPLSSWICTVTADSQRRTAVTVIFAAVLLCTVLLSQGFPVHGSPEPGDVHQPCQPTRRRSYHARGVNISLLPIQRLIERPLLGSK
ncbi:Amino acid transporter [Mycena sanguinolenta]|uniref:Amino acid transporter n=1 Tax=Mycena sanguinolenta TaxID=230812 RepID=A0A8H7CUS1_9AGAR|nr:Amino acid transporter [Mycena sanguinolenta]